MKKDKFIKTFKSVVFVLVVLYGLSKLITPVYATENDGVLQDTVSTIKTELEEKEEKIENKEEEEQQEEKQQEEKEEEKQQEEKQEEKQQEEKQEEKQQEEKKEEIGQQEETIGATFSGEKKEDDSSSEDEYFGDSDKQENKDGESKTLVGDSNPTGESLSKINNSDTTQPKEELNK